jgi:hypothetical protein
VESLRRSWRCVEMRGGACKLHAYPAHFLSVPGRGRCVPVKCSPALPDTGEFHSLRGLREILGRPSHSGFPQIRCGHGCEFMRVSHAPSRTPRTSWSFHSPPTHCTHRPGHPASHTLTSRFTAPFAQTRKPIGMPPITNRQRPAPDSAPPPEPILSPFSPPTKYTPET